MAANDELAARRHSLEIAQTFREDTAREIAAGALPRVEGPLAESEAANRLQDVHLAQQNLTLRALSLKLLLCRVEDPALDMAEIVPLDHIEVPAVEELPPVRTLLNTALENRPHVAVSKIRDETSSAGSNP